MDHRPRRRLREWRCRGDGSGRRRSARSGRAARSGRERRRRPVPSTHRALRRVCRARRLCSGDRRRPGDGPPPGRRLRVCCGVHGRAGVHTRCRRQPARAPCPLADAAHELERRPVAHAGRRQPRRTRHHGGPPRGHGAGCRVRRHRRHMCADRSDHPGTASSRRPPGLHTAAALDPDRLDRGHPLRDDRSQPPAGHRLHCGDGTARRGVRCHLRRCRLRPARARRQRECRADRGLCRRRTRGIDRRQPTTPMAPEHPDHDRGVAALDPADRAG